MAKNKRILTPITAALVLLPVAGISLWLFYDSEPERREVPKERAFDAAKAAKLRVVVTADGQPAEKAFVAALVQGERRRVISRVTNQDGRAGFGALPAGKTTIVVRLKGYANVKRELVLKEKSEQQVEIELERRGAGSSPEPAASADETG